MTALDHPLTPDQAAELLLATPRMLRALLDGLPPGAAQWRPEPEEWCVNECIGHLIEADRHGFAGRIRTILAGDRPQVELWDIGGVAAQRRDAERSSEAVLVEFEHVRSEGVRMAAQLSVEQLTRAGTHPLVGKLRVVDILHEWVHHDQNHLKQIFSCVQAFVWPHLGNAQRFSDPQTLGKLEAGEWS